MRPARWTADWPANKSIRRRMLCLIPSYFRLIDRKKSSKYIAISKLALSVLFCSILSYSQLVNDVDEIGETIYVICLIPFYCSVLFLILTYKKIF